MYQGERCRERLPLKPNATNLNRAEMHRAAIIDSIARGTFDYTVTFPDSKRAKAFKPDSGHNTVRRYLEHWLDRKESQVQSSTANGYRKVVNRTCATLGELELVDLNRRVIREWLEGLEIGNKTLRNIQSCLRTALRDAVDDELIEINPLAGWSYQTREEVKTEDDIDPFDKDEQGAILGALDGQALNLVTFQFWTGMRPSEVVALDWSDVDLRKKEVRVRKSITQAAKGKAEVTKTLSSKRTVRLLAPALAAVKAQKAHTYLKGEELFQNPRTGERWQSEQPIRKTLWIPALKKAQVRYRYPYQTRHTYASMMLSAGEHPMWVAQQMGHKDWTMIARIYGRWMPSADKKAGSRAVEVFGQSDSIATTSTPNLLS